MQKEFVTYQQALALKELGFDEPCLVVWPGIKGQKLGYDGRYFSLVKGYKNSKLSKEVKKYAPGIHDVAAPLYQQAFRWLRNKYLTYGIIMPTNVSEIQGIDCILEIHPPPDKNGIVYILEDSKLYTSYEEAEQACLDKLIEIVKNK